MSTEVIALHKPARLPMAWTAVFFAYFTSFFAISTINNALPGISAELNGISLYSWGIAIPALASAFTTLVFGKLSDIFGRRTLLLVSLAFMLAGALMCATSRSFPFLIASLSVLGLGSGAIQPLCFAVLGDLYPPAERGKWAGLLNIASGITAFICPTLGGWFVDSLSWRLIFWTDIPVIVITAVIVFIGLPGRTQWETRRIDLPGSLLLALASTAMILGLSWAGNAHPWLSVETISLLGASVLLWACFLKVESRAAEPMLDPRVLTNRTFLTASLSALLSIFGFTVLTAYLPLFLQGVLGVSATFSGKVITPFSLFMTFMGIPAGFLIYRTRRYKWIYVTGYLVLAVVTWGVVGLHEGSALGWVVVIAAAAGIGLGMIPTLNAIVVQVALPRRLLGAAMGGLYFFVAMGKAIAPAVLGSMLNSVYSRQLTSRLAALPPSVRGAEMLVSLADPRLLLSDAALAEVGNALGDPLLAGQVIDAVRASLDSGLQSIAIIGAVAMLAAFLLILTIPEIRLDGVEA